MADEKKERRPRGPDPDRLKIEGEWEEAVQKALRKKPPAAKRPRKRKRR